jgi:hypothetical protein
LASFGTGTVLGSREVQYQRCAGCRSIFLTDPDWLDEAYCEAISVLDVGLLERCQQLANVTVALLTSERLTEGSFLDFAGGYGTLTRLMRDRGLQFHHADPLCTNIFARGFEGDLSIRYDLVTAFEVLEHLVDPVATLLPIAQTTDLLLVTTQVLPDPPPAPGTWTYYAEDSGQHITFYTVAGLTALAGALGMQLTTAGNLVHVLHRRPLQRTTCALLRDDRLAYAAGALLSERGRRRGLTLADSLSAARLVREQRRLSSQ